MIYRAPTQQSPHAACVEAYTDTYGAWGEMHRRAAEVLAGATVHDSYRLDPFPPFFEEGRGAYKQGIEGRSFVDYWMGHGALLFGHGFPAVIEAVIEQVRRGTHLGGLCEVMVRWAELVCRLVPSAERVRFTASGTESTMLAHRVARAFTGRPRVLKLAGHFHGWHDESLGHFFPTASAGFNPDALNQVDVLELGDGELALEQLATEDIAGVILEPGGGGTGALPWDAEFLRSLREATSRHGSLLLFDETVSGFRYAPGGVQQLTGVLPDLTILGKILTGGLPGGALAGRAEVMAVFGAGSERDSRRMQVPHTGTFNANPLSAAAGVAMLSQLGDGAPQRAAIDATERLVAGVNEVARAEGIDVSLFCAQTSVFHMVIGARGAGLPAEPSPALIPLFQREVERHAALRRALLLEGVDCHPMHGWVSTAHDPQVIAATVEAFTRAFRRLHNEQDFTARRSIAVAAPEPAATKKMVELFIDGEFRPGAAGRRFDSIEPASEEVIADVALAEEADVGEAVLAARRAFDDGPWPRMSAAERRNYLRAIGDAIEENTETLACLESMDTGLPIQFTRGHVARAVQNFRYFAEEAERISGTTHPLDNAYLHIVTREPVGVVAVITPWNAPLSLATHGLAAALTSGNACVLKPSEHAPMTASELARIFAELELPPGVLNVVHGPGTPTGDALTQHPGVDAIAFTGSSSTGRRIMENAAKGLKRFIAELGGSAPTLIFADCDLDRAIEGTILSAFANNGEACVAGARLLVERPILHEFVERFTARVRRITVGDPLDVETEVGPLISRAHRDRVAGMVEEALAEGARLGCGGVAPPFPVGFYAQPTVVTDVPLHARLACEEVLGPVVAVSAFDSEAEVVKHANDSPYGLAAYVWTQNPERMFRVAQRLRSGTVWANTSLVRDIRVPFGGYKQSGIGRIGGGFSINAFTEVKNTCVSIEPLPLPRLGNR